MVPHIDKRAQRGDAMFESRLLILGLFTMAAIACGGGGGGGSLPVVQEIEPNNEPGQANLIPNRTRVLAFTGSDDTDWFVISVGETRRFDIEGFLDVAGTTVSIQAQPVNGFFEDVSSESTRDGRGRRLRGRFVPTGAPSGIAVRVDHLGGPIAQYKVDVRA